MVSGTGGVAEMPAKPPQKAMGGSERPSWD